MAATLPTGNNNGGSTPDSNSNGERAAATSASRGKRREKKSNTSGSGTSSSKAGSTSTSKPSSKHRSSKSSGGTSSSTSRRSKSKEDKETHTSSPSNGSTPAPKESLTKDRRPNPQIPPQLGTINPLGTCAAEPGANSSEALEDSLRWSSLNNSVSTAPTSDSTSTSFAQQSAQNFLILPPSSATATPPPIAAGSINHPANADALIIAHPDTVTSQLLQAIQQQQQEHRTDAADSAAVAANKEQLADLLQQAMARVLQNATENGSVLPKRTGTTPPSSSDSQQQSVMQMQQQLQQQRQQFLDFQKQMLKQQEIQQTQIQQQAQLLEQQQKLLESQQKQLLDLKNDLLLQSQQSVRSLQRSAAAALSPSPSTSSPVKKNRDRDIPSKKSTTDSDMLDRLKEFEHLEASQQQLEESFALEGLPLGPIQSPKNNKDNTNNNNNSQVNSQDILSTEDSNASIETEYEEDSDYEKDKDETAPQQQQSSSQNQLQSSPSATPSTPTKEEMVDVWVCPKCKFEHEFSRLQFCGVCGSAKPENTNTNKNSDANAKNNFDSPSSAKPPTSPVPPQEPLIQLQLHRELQGSGEGVIDNLDLPPKSPSRKRAPYKRSKSATDVHGRASMTPRRSRQRLPPRAKTQQSLQSSHNHGQSMSATYHGGATQADSVVVKCIDGGDAGAVFDIDVLNQQLSTFESGGQVPAGSAPTASAPKTPKVNKRNAFRRTKSALDEPDNDQPVSMAPPAVFVAKPNVRQAIPRRAKSNSTEQLRMHQMQQNGGMLVPPSPSANKARASILGYLGKSPKKAMSALKIAGSAVPKSLMLGGHGGGGGGHGGHKDRGKNHAFLLDSDPESGDEGNAGGNVAATLEAPLTPGRRSSLEARAKAAQLVTTNQKTSGWKKWFESGSKHNNAAATPAEVEEPIEIDIDDSVHDVDDEDLFEGEDESEEEEAEPEQRRARRHRRNKSSDRPSGSNRNRRRSDMDSLRASSHASGSNRNLQQSGSRGSDQDFRGSRHDLTTTPKRERARLRRTKSLDAPENHDDLDRHGSGHRSNHHTTDSTGQLLMTPSRRRPTRRNSLQRSSSRERSSREFLPDAPNIQDAPDSSNHNKKTEQMKQRVQGLARKTSVEHKSNSNDNANAIRKPVAPGVTEDVSESTDGCTIYLEDMSTGAMSEITHNIY